jgi:hypothetical protein
MSSSSAQVKAACGDFEVFADLTVAGDTVVELLGVQKALITSPGVPTTLYGPLTVNAATRLELPVVLASTLQCAGAATFNGSVTALSFTGNGVGLTRVVPATSLVQSFPSTNAGNNQWAEGLNQVDGVAPMLSLSALVYFLPGNPTYRPGLYLLVTRLQDPVSFGLEKQTSVLVTWNGVAVHGWGAVQRFQIPNNWTDASYTEINWNKGVITAEDSPHTFACTYTAAASAINPPSGIAGHNPAKPVTYLWVDAFRVSDWPDPVV